MAQIKCILYDHDIETIINYDTYILDSAYPPSGLAPNLEYYAKYIPSPEPEFDPRGWILVSTSIIEDIPHPDWPLLKRYKTTYSQARKTDEELKKSVDSMELWANGLLFPDTTRLDKITKNFKAQHKKIKGIPTSESEDALMLEIDSIADKMDDNEDNKDIMYDYIENNPTLVPDFDLGWTIEL